MAAEPGEPPAAAAATWSARLALWRGLLTELPVRRLWALARPQTRRLAWGTLFLAIGSAAGLAFPMVVRDVVDDALQRRDGAAIDDAAALLLGLFGLQAVAIGLRAWLFTVAGERIVSDLRLRLYRHLLEQEIAFFDQERTGDLLSRLSSDATVLQNAVSVNISMALRNVATAVGGIALLLWTSPRLTGLMLVIVPPIALATVFYGRRIRRIAGKVQDAYADANHVAEEALAGIRTVRAHAGEGREQGRYRVAIERAFELAVERTTLSSWFIALSSLGGYGSIAIVVWAGGHMVGRGELTVGDLTSFVLYTLTVAFALGTLGGLWADLMRAVGAAGRVFALLDRTSAMQVDQGRTLERVRGEISFEGVDFTYPARPDAAVIHGLTLQVAPGQVVALVGPSGAGKSTVRALLSRLYDPQAGTVRLDGSDLRELDPAWLRRQVGVVAQEPLLFSTSIAENIRYGRPGASDAEVEAAAQAANADGFIRSFSDGYATQVGERGVRLSGGQKQRIAIARALLADPPILVLDEATSALDAESEHLVKEALDRLMRGRTTVVIAHRLSTVRDADRVVVLDQGRIVEQGRHGALLAQGGLYRRLVERQFAGSAADAAELGQAGLADAALVAAAVA